MELSTLSAIFPEMQRIREDDPYTFFLEVPVNPTKAVTVFFPAATEGQAVNPTAPRSAGPGLNGAANIDSHELTHLPAIRLQFSIPSTYPGAAPPSVNLSTSPSWLPASTAKKLEDDCARLWEEHGRDLVVFSYVDHVQQSADDVFGLISESGALEIRPEYKIAVLDCDIKAKRAAFDKETFECGVCLGEWFSSICLSPGLALHAPYPKQSHVRLSEVGSACNADVPVGATEWCIDVVP